MAPQPMTMLMVLRGARIVMQIVMRTRCPCVRTRHSHARMACEKPQQSVIWRPRSAVQPHGAKGAVAMARSSHAKGTIWRVVAMAQRARAVLPVPAAVSRSIGSLCWQADGSGDDLGRARRRVRLRWTAFSACHPAQSPELVLRGSALCDPAKLKPAQLAVKASSFSLKPLS
jgi:hypothetical protein